MSTQAGAEEPEEANVVVICFPPDTSNVDASWLMANGLPRVIFRSDKRSIKIILYPIAKSNNWDFVKDLVPNLWKGENQFFGLYQDPRKPKTFKIDAMILLETQDEPQQAFRLERNAVRVYEPPVAAKQKPKTEDEEEEEEDDEPYRLPRSIMTDIDTNYLHQKVSPQATKGKVIISDAPNKTLGGHIYYSSLAELYVRNKTMRVMFVRTPLEHKSEDIALGVKVVSKTIETMVTDLDGDTTPQMLAGD